MTSRRTPSISGILGRAFALHVLAFGVLAAVLAYSGVRIAEAEENFSEEWQEFQDLLGIPQRCGEIVALASRTGEESSANRQARAQLGRELERTVARLASTVHRLAHATEQDAREEERVRRLASLVESLLADLSGNVHGAAEALAPRVQEIADLVESIRLDDLIVVDRALEALSRQRRTITYTFLAVAALLLGVSATVTLVVRRGLAQQLRRLREGAERIAGGDFGHRVAGGGYAEFTALATQYHSMADRLATLYADLEAKIQERTRQVAGAQRLAAVGEIASGVAHEVGTPLASIAGCAEGLQARARDGTLTTELLQDYLRIILDATFRCKKVTRDLLDFGRRSEPRLVDVDLAEVVRRAVDLALFARDGGAPEVRLELPAEPVHVAGDALQLGQIVTNLVMNALQSGSRTPIEVTLAQRGASAELAVQDGGVGIAPAQIDAIFEPFFSLREGGTGLGLTVTRDIVLAHGGLIRADSPGEGQGAIFTVTLPCAHVAGGSGPRR